MALRAQGDEAARLAFDVYAYRIRKYVGAYFAVLGSVDAVVFTAGVGQHSPELRAASLAGLERLGIEIDQARNSRPLRRPERGLHRRQLACRSSWCRPTRSGRSRGRPWL